MTKDDAIKAIEGLQYVQDGVLLIEFQYYNQALQDAIEATRALPDVGWIDISEYQGRDEILVWCECESSGLRWLTFAYEDRDGLWYSHNDGHVPAKGYYPLPTPPEKA